MASRMSTQRTRTWIASVLFDHGNYSEDVGKAGSRPFFVSHLHGGHPSVSAIVLMVRAELLNGESSTPTAPSLSVGHLLAWH